MLDFPRSSTYVTDIHVVFGIATYKVSPFMQYFLINCLLVPSAECQYNGNLVCTEMLTGCEVCMAVSGSGTSDEGHRTASA